MAHIFQLLVYLFDHICLARPPAVVHTTAAGGCVNTIRRRLTFVCVCVCLNGRLWTRKSSTYGVSSPGHSAVAAAVAAAVVIIASCVCLLAVFRDFPLPACCTLCVGDETRIVPRKWGKKWQERAGAAAAAAEVQNFSSCFAPPCPSQRRVYTFRVENSSRRRRSGVCFFFFDRQEQASVWPSSYRRPVYRF